MPVVRPKGVRYEGENVEIPASVSDDRFCHFSGTIASGTAVIFFVFLRMA